MNRFVVGVLLIAACGAGSAVTLLVTGARSESPSIRPSASSAPSPAVPRSPRKVRPLTQVAAVQPPPDIEVSDAAARDAGDQPAKRTDREQPRNAEEAPTEAERSTYAESVFESQAYDGNWARESAQRLTAGLSTIGVPSVRTSSVDCRSSLCRIELAAESSEAGESYVRSFIRSATWTSPGMIVRDEPDARGAYVIRIYLARQGTPLPEAAAVNVER
jgi:hypothetical protein